MSTPNEKILQLENKLNVLTDISLNYNRELADIKSSIKELKTNLKNEHLTNKNLKEELSRKNKKISILEKSPDDTNFKEIIKKNSLIDKFNEEFQQKTYRKPFNFDIDLEKFIGENLINKIGIGIIILGVILGFKFAINKNLISPIFKITLGYLSGAILLGISLKLKQKLKDYSAVLLGGAMTILYFVSYAAYSLYHVIPLSLTFILMLLITIFTVIAALNYKNQIIAILGMVGAYAVPFLANSGQSNDLLFIIYLTVVNIGLMVLAFKTYWKLVYYLSFGFTWIIFNTWYGSHYLTIYHFTYTFVFLHIFFFIFYITFLAYKLIKKEAFEFADIFLILINASVFYSQGFNMLSNHPKGVYFTGIFTLANAIIHFIPSLLIYKNKKSDQNLFYLLIFLVIAFITVTIGVELNAQWHCILWSIEAFALFWIGRTKNIKFYERMSYPLILLSSCMLLLGWTNYNPENFTIFLNQHFLKFIIYISCIIGISYTLQKHQKQDDLWNSLIIGSLLIISIYFTFTTEIITFWKNITINLNLNWYDKTIESYIAISLIIFSILYGSVGYFISLKIKNPLLSVFSIAIIVIALISQYTIGENELGNLRFNYFHQNFNNQISSESITIFIRYIVYGIVLFSLWIGNLFIKKYKHLNYSNIIYDYFLHFSLIVLLSSEIINLTTLANHSQKYNLSIVWGLYALGLITYGILKAKQHIRIGSIALLAITLLKLFLFDITHIDGLTKTFLFILIGIILLIISFLYNKHKIKHLDETDI